MTNRVLGVALVALLLYVTGASELHHHAAADLAQQHCAACLWHSSAVMETPIVSAAPMADLPLLVTVRSPFIRILMGTLRDQQSRAPPVTA